MSYYIEHENYNYDRSYREDDSFSESKRTIKPNCRRCDDRGCSYCDDREPPVRMSVSRHSSPVRSISNFPRKNNITPIEEENFSFSDEDSDVGFNNINITNPAPINGKNGKNGTHGQNGRDGQDGQDGRDGQDGEDGQNGKNGQNGGSGRPGRDGQDGRDGVPGQDGRDGRNGRDGATGKDGKDGKDGTNGTNGKDGADGKDGIARLQFNFATDNSVNTGDYVGQGTSSGNFLRSSYVVPFSCITKGLVFSIRTTANAISYKATLSVNGVDTTLSTTIADGSVGSHGAYSTGSIVLNQFDLISMHVQWTAGALSNGVCGTLLCVDM